MSKPRKRETLGYILLTFLVIILDQGFKFVTSVFFEVVKNQGVGLGLFSGQTFNLVALGFGVLTIILWKNNLSSASALLLGGAVSNLIDRLRFGYVVDYIDISKVIPGLEFPVFNLADVAIIIGAVLLLRVLLPKAGRKYG